MLLTWRNAPARAVGRRLTDHCPAARGTCPPGWDRRGRAAGSPAEPGSAPAGSRGATCACLRTNYSRKHNLPFEHNLTVLCVNVDIVKMRNMNVNLILMKE